MDRDKTKKPADSAGFFSSDSGRSSSILKYAQYLHLEEAFPLSLGGSLEGCVVCYETYGSLNRTKSNAVLVFHALSGDSHIASHNDKDDPGWWEIMVGRGKMIDTEKYFVICANVLGGCRGTTGPGSINPKTGNPYGSDFPTITIGDMVDLQYRMVKHLEIEKLLAVVGASMGGQLVMDWAVRYPEAAAGVIAVATSTRLTAQSLAFDIVGRNAIQHDENFHDGAYESNNVLPSAGLAIARMIGHITYLSPESMGEKFETDRYSPKEISTKFEKKFSVGSYLGYQGDKFVDRFDANSYITLSTAMDLFDLGGSHRELVEVFSPSRSRWLGISFSSDWLFPPVESEKIVNALLQKNIPVSYCSIKSSGGHDSFLLPETFHIYGGLISNFLCTLDTGCTDRESLRTLPGRTESIQAGRSDPTHIFDSTRLDYSSIIDLVKGGSSLLDLGCGGGELLEFLKYKNFERLVGVELDEGAILSCLEKGLDVIQLDLNTGLSQFLDKQFEWVVLSRTLQTIFDVENLIREIVRVGSKAVVSIPNFAYRKLREMFCKQGRAPEAPGVLKHHWYNTPNYRFFTIDDFNDLCLKMKVNVHKRIALDTESREVIIDDPNLNADMAIFVISD
jgi:homoserine O-acetyltransferase/O-succinyltransferase